MKSTRNKPAKKGTKHDVKRLKALRERLGVSQRDLAEEWYVSVGAITHWETGIRPMPGVVLKLIEIYEDHADVVRPKK